MYEKQLHQAFITSGNIPCDRHLLKIIDRGNAFWEVFLRILFEIDLRRMVFNNRRNVSSLMVTGFQKIVICIITARIICRYSNISY